ncbi:hypothetical protein [Streptomyces sp. NPDC052811]|uniref:hypothetical protein n=1 Tax=Streptomyces sp. NPDC052811 TaxID=3155731 RepID=UPI0034210CBE
MDGLRPAFADVELKACAKFGRPRSVYVAPGPMELLDPYLLLERPEIVAKAQRSLRRRHRELFVIQRLEADGTRVRGVLNGLTITRTIKNMKPDLRRLAVLETGDGQRVSQSTARKHDQKLTEGITRLRRRLKDNRLERQRLQDEVDGAATVIAAPLAENAALRERLGNRSAVVISLGRTQAARE